MQDDVKFIDMSEDFCWQLKYLTVSDEDDDEGDFVLCSLYSNKILLK